MRTENVPVVIVGGGSAAFEAAVAAKQAGAPKVVMLEKAPEPEFGGNARFSHTGFRWVFSGADRSEEHTSELQSHVNLVCRLLLEKKKKKKKRNIIEKQKKKLKQKHQEAE